MPYLLRSRGRRHEIRDGTLSTDPLYLVTPEAWSPFEHLPRGMLETGDGDCEVRFVENLDGLRRAPLARIPEWPAPDADMPTEKTEEPEPVKRKPRVR